MPEKQLDLFELNEDDRVCAESQLKELQRSVSFDTKEFTVEIIVHKFRNDELFRPSYQREFVWNQAKQSRFVESVLLGLPIPFMFGADDVKTGKIEIVDGVQRIGTVTDFLNNKLKLGPLERLTGVSGFRFDDLSPNQQRRFKNRTLRMVVLESHADITTRFDIFDRINTSGTMVKPSELRKGAFPGKFYDLVHTCAADTDFRSVCRISGSLARQAEHEELVLRFFAYSERYKAFVHDVWRFLNEYLKEMNQGFDERAKRAEFDRMVRFVGKHFPYGFGKDGKAKTTPRVRFEAISVGVNLALSQKPRLVPRNVSWLDSEEFKKHTTTHASNSGPRLQRRVEFVRDALLENLR